MNTFTPTELRSDSGRIYNSVQDNGVAIIDHRDRPEMLIMTTKHYEEMLEKHYITQTAIAKLP